MPSHDSTLEEIKDRIDIVDLISDYVHLKKAGQNWKGLCPFHTEKTPSFMVSPAKQIFHCFGCGSGGDIFTFLAKYESLTFPEALSMLAQRAGVTLKTTRTSSAQAGEKELLVNMHRDAVQFFRHHLSKNKNAMSYLERRGMTPEYIDSFGLGYAPKSWNALLNYLMKKGYKPDAMKKAGLVTQGNKGSYDTFRDRIIFPIYDLKGDAIAFGGRSIDGSEPKYLNSPETPIFNKRKVMYGLNRAKEAIRKSGHIMVMEGYLDVIAAHMFGFKSAVAGLGTALTPDHGRLIKRFVEEVVIVFDSDQAGIKAAKSASGVLLESGLDVRILAVPENEDPDSFLREKGKEAFEQLLREPLSVVDFFVKQGGKKHIVADELFEVIAKIPNEILQEEYISMLADRINVEEPRVRERFYKKRQQLRTGQRRPKPQVRRAPGPKPQNELYMIKLMMQMPDRIRDISESLSQQDFSDPLLRGIFNKLKEGNAELNVLLSQCEGEEQALVTKISLMEDLEDPDRVLSDCMGWMRLNKREKQKKELQSRIKEAEKSKDMELLRKLQAEFQELLKK